jgi:hypothetical protein
MHYSTSLVVFLCIISIISAVPQHTCSCRTRKTRHGCVNCGNGEASNGEVNGHNYITQTNLLLSQAHYEICQGMSSDVFVIKSVLKYV